MATPTYINRALWHPMESEELDPRGALQAIRVAPWPIIKHVGVTGPDLLRSGGQLIIAPGTLACIQRRPSGDNITVVHESNSVDVYTARLVPPWFNATVQSEERVGCWWRLCGSLADELFWQTSERPAFQ